MTRVYKGVNKPLLIWGVERRLFFLSLIIGAGTFNFFGSLIGGVVMFVVLYLLARWSTAIDPQMLRIVINSTKFRPTYDPLKFDALRRGDR